MGWETMLYSPGENIGGYTIIRRIGQGGMGVVFEARSEDGTRVALKIPHPQLLEDPGTRARYDRELEVSRSLIHPYIQRVVSTGVDDKRDLPFLALEWVEGGLLRDFLRSDLPLSVDESISFGAQLCEALYYCHDLGIVHRDIKPDNILVTKAGKIQLMDFGASLLESAPKITTASLAAALGTPDYMAPEQVEGQRGDVRSDVYSLGAMMYELLTGQPPYHGDNALAVMAQHVQSSPVSIRKKNRQVGPSLEEVIFKAMRRDPALRYQSMMDLHRDLTNLASVDTASLSLERVRVTNAINSGASTTAVWSRSVPVWVMVVVIAIAALTVGTLLVGR